MTRLTLDNEKQAFFYEQDFYPFSNFSAFRLNWRGNDFDTLEHTYHWEKFHYDSRPTPAAFLAQQYILKARSAHDAFKIAQEYKADRNPKWDMIKVPVMAVLMFCKAHQHTYVQHKLSQLGDKMPIENSWRDPFWGWGEDRNGLNMAGECWKAVQRFWVEEPEIFNTPLEQVLVQVKMRLPSLIGRLEAVR